MHFNTKAISFVVAALQCASVAFAQTTCWAASDCSGAKYDTQATLFAFATAFCTANALKQSGTGTSTSGLSTAIFANGPYASVGDCSTAFDTIVGACLGKVNGGTFLNTLGNPNGTTTTILGSSTTSSSSTTTSSRPPTQSATPRLVVSFGNCEVV